ncbi:hypothetical protein M2451_001766 [Dysgonomonas sp. PFB1-18]|uniref:DUF4492 domain-containing protein n=1 Tax=unclassified Dysgonomonas TaxID=2630389 RepID=UPI0024731C72|nr:MULTISPECIES: DUF4492 domain-containing protein [unclassified Dysgonomonas]MDH6309195.1 hypothetical protein [Dysgonomonas sp. PF1-14]MDH6338925.1 hypothetical protein [Dysgonomonas sp. PF1-16]MDH6380444.1 hypothetical protein [Dysgonomonas sp. PFB1-18]MDH6397753.1 hypothetical protein [Dysgonomonas sp. PF1-23]
MNETMPRFNFFTMFRDGFKSMTLGKTLWTIVIIKLIIMFLILRPFFFPNFLNSKFDDAESKSDYVTEELINNSTVNE